MKNFKKLAALMMAAFMSNVLIGQVEYTGPFSAVLAPANAQVGLRVKSKLLTQYVSGNEGGFAAGDKWIGIGAPVASLFGDRIQWAGQGFSKALRDVGGTKNAIIEWGNQGGEMQIRYVTNPVDPVNGFRRILTHTAAGNSYFGRTSPIIAGKVGITADTNQFALVASAFNSRGGFFRTSQFANFNFGIGVQAQSFSTSSALTNVTNYGLLATASGFGSGGRNYGVYGIASGPCTNINYGVFGSAPANCPGSGTPASTNWAGFFQGDLFVSGNPYFASDERLKVNVKPEVNLLPKLIELVPVNYNFGSQITTDAVPVTAVASATQQNATAPTQQATAATTVSASSISLPGGLQHGLIAQRVRELFPELVSNVRYSIPGEDGEKASATYLAVNYVSLVPLLLQGIKELDEKVKRLEAVVGAPPATARTAGVETNGNVLAPSAEEKVVTANGTFYIKDFKLSQNTPNPFSTETTIQYSIPTGINRAQLAIFDLNGTMKMQFNNLNGTSRVVINGSALQAGMYIYSILVDGKDVVTKKMILTK